MELIKLLFSSLFQTILRMAAVPALITSAMVAVLLLDQFPSLPSQYQHRSALALLSTLSLGEDEHSLGPSLVKQAVIRRRWS